MWRSLLILFIVLSAAPAWATKYWVATTGSDANACSAVDGDADPGTYKKTVLGGWNCLVGGDTLHIKAGTYTGSDGLLNSPTLHNGTAGAPTIVEGEGIGVTVMSNTFWYFGSSNNTYVTFRDVELNGTGQAQGNDGMGLCAAGGGHITVTRMKVSNYNSQGIQGICNFITIQNSEMGFNGITGTNQAHGAYLQGTDTLFEYNYVHDTRGLGMGLQCYKSGATDASRCIVRYNRFIANPNGMVLDGPDDQVYNNIIANGTDIGIKCGYPEGGTGCVRAQIHNNTIYNNTHEGIYIGLFGAGTDAVVKNNIVINNSSQVFVAGGVTGVVQANNACKTADSCGTTGKLTIALLTTCTVSTSDFTLKSGATCIDAGTALTGFSYNGSAPDIGAFETVVFSTCSVEDGDASTLRVTFTNNVNPPLLPATGVTTFTARKAGANDVVTAAVRTGTNRIDLTLTNAIVAGNAVDVSWASGNLTDSALIGNTLNQPYVTALSNQSCTNNVSAPASFQFEQHAFRFNGLRGTEAAPVATPYATAPESTNVFVRVGGSVRLRASIKNSVSDPPPTGFLWYVSHNGGAYGVMPVTFGADHVAYCGTGPDPDIPQDFTPTTNQLSTTGTFVAGALLRTSNAVPTVDIALNGKTEIEGCFSWDTSVTAGDTFDFRLRQQDGTVLNTYTVTPRATIAAERAGMGF
jgi:hypothetical protein